MKPYLILIILLRPINVQYVSNGGILSARPQRTHTQYSVLS
ncbi:hypothetical protein PJ15_1557 [Acinetobacter sp. neg1]|nr:hypothetical protein PJ15_1557 [Acinetobacter sp. neg1]